MKYRFWLILGTLLWAKTSAAEMPPLLIIDPGHGGSNLGAQGPQSKIYEKRLCLELARSVEKELRQKKFSGQIIFTRSKDEYVLLSERVRRANVALAQTPKKDQAALLISLHYNAATNRAQNGFAAYILSRQASNQEAGRLAILENLENSETAPKKTALPKTPPAPTVTNIVADLRQKAAQTESTRAAKLILEQLRQARGSQLDRGIHQAPFDVLLGLHMPAVLVEVGFINHPQEELQIVDPVMTKQIASALALAIENFFAPVAK